MGPRSRAVSGAPLCCLQGAWWAAVGTTDVAGQEIPTAMEAGEEQDALGSSCTVGRCRCFPVACVTELVKVRRPECKDLEAPAPGTLGDDVHPIAFLSVLGTGHPGVLPWLPRTVLSPIPKRKLWARMCAPAASHSSQSPAPPWESFGWNHREVQADLPQRFLKVGPCLCRELTGLIVSSTVADLSHAPLRMRAVSVTLSLWKQQSPHFRGSHSGQCILPLRSSCRAKEPLLGQLVSGKCPGTWEEGAVRHSSDLGQVGISVG